jgi:hypothetical protein
MCPTLDKNSIEVYIGTRFLNDLKVGDIVIYKDNNWKYVEHRITEKYGSTYYIEGDNPLGRKEFVEKGQIIGKRLFSIPLPWSKC